jgi:hypothetical protein
VMLGRPTALVVDVLLLAVLPLPPPPQDARKPSVNRTRGARMRWIMRKTSVNAVL